MITQHKGIESRTRDASEANVQEDPRTGKRGDV